MAVAFSQISALKAINYDMIDLNHSEFKLGWHSFNLAFQQSVRLGSIDFSMDK